MTATATAGRRSGEAGRSTRRPRRLRVLGGGLRTAVFVIAAALGLLGVAMTAAPAFGWQVVTLVTGSMSPTFPAGSLVLVHDSPAAAARVGDVVMITRPGELPITHRVVDIAPSGGILPTRELTLRGDGNADPDPLPYVVERVGVVAGGIGWGGGLLQDLRSPVGLAVLTTIIAALILWSWWPRDEAEPDQPEPGEPETHEHTSEKATNP